MKEWVLVMSRGDDFYLTENQYQYYKDNYQDGKIFFKTFEINPPFVVSARQRPVEALLDMYPCHACLQTGKALGKVCENCDGTGVDIKNA